MPTRKTFRACGRSPRDAARAGAFGFSTSRTISHKTLAGDFHPGSEGAGKRVDGHRHGPEGGREGGFIEMTSDWNTPDPATEFAMVRRIMEACGRPLVFSSTSATIARKPGRICWTLSDQGRGRRRQRPLRGATTPHRRPARLVRQPEPVRGNAHLHEMAHLPLEERVAADARSGGPRANARRGSRPSSTRGRCSATYRL